MVPVRGTGQLEFSFPIDPHMVYQNTDSYPLTIVFPRPMPLTIVFLQPTPLTIVYSQPTPISKV